MKQAFLLLLLAPRGGGVVRAQQPVTSARILNAAKEPQNWLTYSGNYNGQRYSTLDQITPANVKNLNLEWVFQVRSLGAADKFEATPIVVDGVHVHRQPAERRRRARRGHRPAVLALQPQRRAGGACLLRARQPRRRHSRQLAVHGDHRRPRGRAQRENRRGASGTSRSIVRRLAMRSPWRRSSSRTS